MRWPRLLAFFLLAGAIGALVGGFFTGAVGAVLELGPIALVTASPLGGFLGAMVGLRIMLLPAVVLGGLLWSRGIRNTAAWAGIGALAGLGCFAVLLAFPERIDEMAIMVFRVDQLPYAALFAAAGAPAALAFRLMMEALTAFDEAPSAD